MCILCSRVARHDTGLYHSHMQEDEHLSLLAVAHVFGGHLSSIFSYPSVPSKPDARIRTVILRHLEGLLSMPCREANAFHLHAERARYLYPRACALILRVILFIVGCRRRSEGCLIPPHQESKVLTSNTSLPMVPHTFFSQVSLGSHFPYEQRPSLFCCTFADRS